MSVTDQARTLMEMAQKDLSLLLGTLKHEGQHVDRFWDLMDFTMYAVRFRYESYPSFEELLDRSEVTRRVADLVNHVNALLAGAKS